MDGNKSKFTIVVWLYDCLRNAPLAMSSRKKSDSTSLCYDFDIFIRCLIWVRIRCQAKVFYRTGHVLGWLLVKGRSGINRRQTSSFSLLSDFLVAKCPWQWHHTGIWSTQYQFIHLGTGEQYAVKIRKMSGVRVNAEVVTLRSEIIAITARPPEQHNTHELYYYII